MKVNRPINPSLPVPQQGEVGTPIVPQQATPSFRPEDFGLKDGPLGRKQIKPGTKAQFDRIQRLISDAEQERDVSVRAGEENHAPQKEAEKPREDVQETQQAAAVVPQMQFPPDPTPEEVTPPAPREDGMDTPTTERGIRTDDMPLGPLYAIAESGAESRSNPSARLDADYFKYILGRASPERRKIFDAKRCGPIDWDALRTSYDLRQAVTIWTKPKIEVVYRTMTADDEHLARRILAKDFGTNAQEEVLGSILTTIGAGTVSIAGKALPPLGPTHTTSFETRLAEMQARIAQVRRFPWPLLVDVAINYSWFVMRVVRAQMDNELGNG